MARKKIGEILIAAGLIDQAGIRAGLAEQQRWGGPLGRILIDLRLVSEANLVQALSQQLAVPAVDLDGLRPGPEILALVPAEFALDHTVVPFAKVGKFLDLAMADPTNQGISDELRMRTQLNIRAHLAGPKAIELALARWYGRGPGMLSAAMQRETSVTVSRSHAITQPNDYDLDLELGRMGSALPSASPTLVTAVAPPPSTPSLPTASQRTASVSIAPAVIGQAPTVEEFRALQSRITKLEALISRDEDVLRKLLALLVEKQVASREEILERLR
jgi:hypothetical protein